MYKYFIKLVGNTDDDTTKNLYFLFKFASVAVLAILVLALSSIVIEKNPTFGAFGDFFGGLLNPILTFLMFMGLLITIILQQKELSLTRKEYEKSANALDAARIEAEKQTAILLNNSKKTDIYNFLNSSKNELDNLLFSKSRHISEKSISDQKWWQFRFEYQRLKEIEEIRKDEAKFHKLLMSYGSVVGLDFDRIVIFLDLYYNSLLELKKLETKKYLVDNFASLYVDQVNILKNRIQFDSNIDKVLEDLS